MSPLLWENGRTPVAYVGDVNSLFWNFISFPRKPSYSASGRRWLSRRWKMAPAGKPKGGGAASITTGDVS